MTKDPLFLVNSKIPCPVCGGDRRARRECKACETSGFKPVDMANMWAPSPAFLVCGGPSINTLPFHKLSERGIVSLAVNNSAGHVPVSAWVYSDPQTKFHSEIFLDPKIMTFSPIPKLRKTIRFKLPNGQFRDTKIRVKDCPNTFGFSRKTLFSPESFLTEKEAHWGRGGKQPQREFTCLCTMLLGIRLLHYLGCPRVYMLGVDFNMTDKEQYSFSQHTRPHNGRYWKENHMLKELKPYFEKDGFKLFNCNPSSACDAFEYVHFGKAFEDCKGTIRPDNKLDLADWYSKNIAEEHVRLNPKPISIDEYKAAQKCLKEECS